MSDKLDLTKPEGPHLVHSRSERPAIDEAKLLAAVGERLRPDGTNWVATVAIHFYRSAIGTEFLYFVQSTDLQRLPEIIVNDGLKEQGRAIMRKYGHKPPRKIGESNDI